jgi:hypothetical protein
MNSEYFAQSPDALSNFFFVHPRVAEYYSWPGRPRLKAMGYSGDANATRCSVGHQSLFRDGFCGPQHDVSSGAIPCYLNTGAKVPMYCFQQRYEARCGLLAAKVERVEVSG